MKKQQIRVEITGGMGKTYLSKFIKEEFPKYSKDKIEINTCHESMIQGDILLITRTVKEK